MQMYISKDDQQIGPFAEEMVLAMLRNNQLSPNDLAIRFGEKEWRPVGQLFANQMNRIAAVFNPPAGEILVSSTQRPRSGWIRVFLLLGGFVCLLMIVASQIFPVSEAPAVTENLPQPMPITLEDWEAANEKRMREHFEREKSKFVILPTTEQLTAEPYIRGKILFYSSILSEVSNETWTLMNQANRLKPIDRELSALSGRFAQTPAEIGTIVLQQCKPQLAGTYEVFQFDRRNVKKKVPGYEYTCTVTIIDHQLAAIIYRKVFYAKMDDEVELPDDFSRLEKLTARIPHARVARFLAGLPHK